MLEESSLESFRKQEILVIWLFGYLVIELKIKSKRPAGVCSLEEKFAEAGVILQRKIMEAGANFDEERCLSG